MAIYQGDARQVLAEMPAGSVDCIVTSPPYWACATTAAHIGPLMQVWSSKARDAGGSQGCLRGLKYYIG
ncbi:MULTISPECIES: hypothetical protein [Nonomuraea]|uniref:site-specific DNA-methyltransferase (cytosine-N(4)-specific) n=1 Tax=Nonomuraea ferruginea TaxID=46174 RepID=A0ABT4SW08_9ACTN|nr:hypothetical protein [Nonomuraea ferruginea]MDA0641075.1 hypothetical protein [Nonomuraea ferruginea]